MIAILTGAVEYIGDQAIILMVSGVGFKLFVPDESVFSKNQQISLFIHMTWNQENGPSLFGFRDQNSKDIFCLIIGCSGLGPKIGLAILSQMTIDEFINAIVFADIKALSSISGIGSKKAEVMIMQLKDKISKLTLASSSNSGDNINHRVLKDVMDALSSLSYSKHEVLAAVEFIKKECKDKTSFDESLRKGLAFLAKRI